MIVNNAVLSNGASITLGYILGIETNLDPSLHWNLGFCFSKGNIATIKMNSG